MLHVQRGEARGVCMQGRVHSHTDKSTNSEAPRHIQVHFQTNVHRNNPRAMLNKQRCSASKNKPGEFLHSCPCSAAPAPTSGCHLTEAQPSLCRLRLSTHQIQPCKNSFRCRQQFAAFRSEEGETMTNLEHNGAGGRLSRDPARLQTASLPHLSLHRHRHHHLHPCLLSSPHSHLLPLHLLGLHLGAIPRSPHRRRRGPAPRSPLPSRPPQPSQSLFRRRGSRQPPPLTVPRTGEDAERRRTGAAHPSSWCRGGFSAQPRPLPAACAPTLRAGVRPAASPRRRPALPGRGLRQAPPRHRRCYRRRSAARPQPWQRRGGGGAGPPAGSGAAAAPVVPERPRTSGGARKRGSPEGGGRPSGEGSSGRRRDATRRSQPARGALLRPAAREPSRRTAGSPSKGASSPQGRPGGRGPLR